MTNSLENAYSLDVEADGPCPDLYSMLSFALVPLARPEQAFYTTMAPMTDRFLPGAMAKSGFTREQALALPEASIGMQALGQWLQTQPKSGRPVVWSDNPAFDWQFLNYYCHRFLGDNPFGHSARRIGDYFAGLQRDPRKTQDWKRLRTEAHTHNALEDARGNAGALARLLLDPKARPVRRPGPG